MASGFSTDKIISDIQDCVHFLKRDFIETNIPINDDNTILHRLCSKLEFILQNGLKEKSSLLGSKKGYWNYFCLCLASSKGIHDGLKYVKILPEIHTSLGRGRAFIRFCLMNHCLADTLQNCFMNNKVTSDWYNERSILRDTKIWTFLISYLYELNDINFDLTPRSDDLDVAWPTFARKLFLSTQSWRPPSRSVSISSLLSVTSQNDSGLTLYSASDCASPTESIEIENLREELAQAEATQFQLLQKIEKHKKAEQEIHQFQIEYEKKNLELEEKWKNAEFALKAKLCDLDGEIKQKLQQEFAKECDQKVKQVNENWQNKEKMHFKREQELKSHVRKLEDEKADLLSELDTLQKSLTDYELSVKGHDDTVLKLQFVTNDLHREKQKLYKILEKEVAKPEEFTESDCNIEKKVRDFMGKLEMNDQAILEMVANKKEMDCKFHRMLEIGLRFQQLTTGIKSENAKLLKEISNERVNLQHSKSQLNDVQEINETIKEEISEFEGGLIDSPRISQSLDHFKLQKFEMKSDFQGLLLQMKDIIYDLQNYSRVSSEEPSVLPYLIKLKKIREALEKNLSEDSSKVEEYEIQKKQVDKNISLAKTLAVKQEGIIDTLHNKLDYSLKENRHLNSQMCVLRDMLQCHFSSSIFKVTDSPQSHIDSSLHMSGSSQTNEIDNNCLNTKSNVNAIHIDLAKESDYDSSLIVTIIQSTLSKLENLSFKVQNLHEELESSHSLNTNLISRVQDQELQLKGITKELEKAQSLVAVLKKEHNKLHSAEDILKYELQEKRKLLNRLRHQLESTREEWNRVRQKNSESEAEWQNLREEFVKRHKQPSEESGFVDDKSSDDPIPNSRNNILNSTSDYDTTCLKHSTSPCNIIEEKSNENANMTVPTKSRLEILEEQCQLLYSSLVAGSKKSEKLNNRLQALYRGTIVKSDCSGISRTPTDTNSNPEPLLNVKEHDQQECDLHNFHNLKENDVSNENLNQIVLQEQDIEHESLIDNNDSEMRRDSVESCSVNQDEVMDILTVSTPEDLENNENFSSLEQLSPEGYYRENECEYVQNLNCTLKERVEEDSDEMEFNSTSDHNFSNSSQSNNSLCFQKQSSAVRQMVLKNLVGRFKSEQERHQTKEANLQADVEALKQMKKDLEHKLELLQQQNLEILSKEGDFRKRAEFIFRNERNEFNEQINQLKDARKSLQNSISSLTQKVKTLEAELEHTRTQLLLSKASKEQEISTLQLQLSTEALKYERALKRYSEQDNGLLDMKKKVNDQEELIVALENALAEIKEERELEKEHQWQELEELQIALITRDDECTALNEELRKSVAQLDEEQNKNNYLESHLSETKVASQNTIASMEIELVQLRGDSRELRKKLIKLIKEKDILWKRTDHLSYLQRIQVADRWMQDHEANNCLGCKNRFTFMLRKHHCRLCGRIFCHSCSNNWLLTTSSRRRARVCNECYIQHIQLQKEVRRGSDVPTVAEDSEEDDTALGNISFNPLFNSSFDSEIPFSMSNSVTSLPAKGIESTSISPQLFSSAPDLRWYSINQEDKVVSHPKYISKTNSIQEEDDKNHDFDVISDEEIAKSLSTSSPYNPYANENEPQISNTDVGFPMTLTRTTAEIEAAGDEGISGEMWVNAGMSCGVPVLCENLPVILHWKFVSDPQTISFKLVFQEGYDSSSQELLISSSQPNTEDQHELQSSGLYILLFDNSFSRVMARKVQYTLWVKHIHTSESVS